MKKASSTGNVSTISSKLHCWLVLLVPWPLCADGGESLCQRLAAADLAQRPASALLTDSCQRDPG